jgi:hypothetical protein
MSAYAAPTAPMSCSSPRRPVGSSLHTVGRSLPSRDRSSSFRPSSSVTPTTVSGPAGARDFARSGAIFQRPRRSISLMLDRSRIAASILDGLSAGGKVVLLRTSAGCMDGVDVSDRRIGETPELPPTHRRSLDAADRAISDHRRTHGLPRRLERSRTTGPTSGACRYR